MARRQWLITFGLLLLACLFVFVFHVKDLSVRVVVAPRNRTKELLDAVPKFPSPKAVHTGVEVGAEAEVERAVENRVRVSTTGLPPRLKKVTTPKEPKEKKVTEAPVVEEKALPRILCWVMCDPNDLEKRVKHVKATWAQHCDITLYMSSERNDTFPTIGLDVPAGRSHIGIKSRTAWTYVHDHYLDQADYFVKCDPDTFLIIPNMKEYLSHRDPNEPELFGHRFYLGGNRKGLMYNSGGPGQLMSREALKRMVEDAFKRPGEPCMPDGQGEDWKTAKCLQLVGTKVVDTRDSEGRETFMVFKPSTYVGGKFPDWYLSYDVDGALWGFNRDCCSDRPIGFHYINVETQYLLYYMFYQVKHIGHDHPHMKTEAVFYTGK